MLGWEGSVARAQGPTLGISVQSQVCNACVIVNPPQWRSDLLREGWLCNRCGMKQRQALARGEIWTPEPFLRVRRGDGG